METMAKETLQKYYAQTIQRCLDGFRQLQEGDWKKKTSGLKWSAKDYLGHLVSSHEQEGEPLTHQALAGEEGRLPGAIFQSREDIDKFNDYILADLGDPPVPELLERFQAAYQAHLRLLEGLSEADLDKPATNPGWDRPGTVRDLFYMSYLHLPGHYQDIRRIVGKKKLPHWLELCSPEEIHYQLDHIFRYMPLIYWSQRGGDLRASFLFTMEGEGGGQWTIHIADGRAETQPGASEKADVEVRTTPINWIDLSTKELNAAWAIASRKVHIKGNPALALRLDNLFQVT